MRSPRAARLARKSTPLEPAVPAEIVLTAAEQTRLHAFDTQRRLQLLRVILPGLLVIVLAAIPFAIRADIGSHSMDSSRQLAIGLIAFAVGVWAVQVRRVNLASFCLFAGVAGVLIYLILSNGPLQNILDLSAIPSFCLLALPIVIAGVFGGPLLVAVATAATSGFTIATILLTPHGPMLAATMNQPGGLSVFTVPLATQIATGILMFAATRGFRRTIRELGTIRIAYTRERELDRLKDQFISSVNHELRTPIMALQGYIELARALGSQGDSARQEQMLVRGAQAVDHLSGLVKSVLNVRRVEADAADMTFATFSLHPVVIAATELLDPREAEEASRPLHLHIGEYLTVRGDRDRVRQIILNLLSNAVKYSPPGSPVEVTARAIALDAGDVGPATRGMAEIAVHDHGLGIPPDQAPLLFNRFVRLERDIASSVWGTGLGLAICRSYVEAMGGQIWVESTGLVGAGATFRFTLPLAATAPSAASSTSSSAASSAMLAERGNRIEAVQ